MNFGCKFSHLFNDNVESGLEKKTCTQCAKFPVTSSLRRESLGVKSALCSMICSLKQLEVTVV